MVYLWYLYSQDKMIPTKKNTIKLLPWISHTRVDRMFSKTPTRGNVREKPTNLQGGIIAIKVMKTQFVRR